MKGIIALLVAVTLVAVGFNQAYGCLPNFIHGPPGSISCYLFSKKVHTWNKADRRCKRFKTLPGRTVSLVRIETAIEDAFILARQTSNVWIWLRRRGANDWHWQDCFSEYVLNAGMVTNHYSNFAPDEPNNHANAPEDCGSKVLPNGTWYDFPERKTQKFVCEDRPDLTVFVVGAGVQDNPLGGGGGGMPGIPVFPVVDVCYRGLGSPCIYGPEFVGDYYVVAGKLVVYNPICTGEYQLYYP